MPDALSDALRRIADANLRYYEGLGRLTVDYVRALAGLWGDARGSALPPRPAAAHPSPPPAPAPPTPALVLEGEAGAEAGGIFRVSNDLQRRVSAPVVVSAFHDDAGGERRFPVRVEPAVVALEAGENTLVQVWATVPDELEPGASCLAEVTVPGLAGGGIPLLLRRLPDPPAAEAVRPGEEASGTEGGEKDGGAVEAPPARARRGRRARAG